MQFRASKLYAMTKEACCAPYGNVSYNENKKVKVEHSFFFKKMCLIILCTRTDWDKIRCLLFLKFIQT